MRGLSRILNEILNSIQTRVSSTCNDDVFFAEHFSLMRFAATQQVSVCTVQQVKTRDQEDLGEANIRIFKPFECKILTMIKHKLSSDKRESSANDR